jgi:predicted small metal-binding protein
VKQFSCGDVVPGCQRTFTAPSERDILVAVAAHAQQDHGMAEVPAAVVEQVRGQIVSV